jgi:hypothetical protein
MTNNTVIMIDPIAITMMASTIYVKRLLSNIIKDIINSDDIPIIHLDDLEDLENGA